MADEPVKPTVPLFTIEEVTTLLRVLRRSDFVVNGTDLMQLVSALSKLQAIAECLGNRAAPGSV